MDRLGETKRVRALRQLVCSAEMLAGQICRQPIGYPGDPNIWLLTPVGEDRPVYRVECPTNQDEGYCSGSKLVVFLPDVDDPDEEARIRTDPWFIKYCAVPGCNSPIDWEDWEEAEQVGEEDEVRYIASCQPAVSWWRWLCGIQPKRHTYVLNLAWIEDEEDDWDEIPDHLPADIISPREPVLV